ncbi:MAG: hypothetical protein KJ970_14400 [Candidatus Eisenbacteria bacterium]|uniref:Uncharacterized protein n=1 Tax=Eiseniibacteriota bacterium TaxID=2212470 RepID=A0A948WDR6_UNCEI|nr:hypothetical protein [Candidatus Eisenbacteria bacterium]MBU1949145.1 hypothetical protein [Candidatus Eisenbacteria bacterium]MBU2692108.1 hypothetical protein [Candidatus Eisenbacteria bacterium]
MEPIDYAAHPYLDPQFSSREPRMLRALYRQYLIIRNNDEAYNAFLNKLLHPHRQVYPLRENLRHVSSFLAEVGPYLDGLLGLFPEKTHGPLAPAKEIDECDDLRNLMRYVFDSTDPKLQFEAQRKIYLSKLFFDVDHTWEIQRGLIHKRHFESLMDEYLFRNTVDEADVEICFNIRSDGVSMDYTVGSAGPDKECWSFHKLELALPIDGHTFPLNVYFYSCRFKREIIPYQYMRGQEHYNLQPVEIWGRLKERRSGSIVSKMIRKKESNPRRIGDILGAMFIVADLVEVERLKTILMDIFGGPLRFRHVTDTLIRMEDKGRLGRYSAAGYKVFKSEVDLLYPSGPELTGPPSLFTVEIQIYTLESYLRTIHTEHYASHQHFKHRQFLQGLLPYLFPSEIYGTLSV